MLRIPYLMSLAAVLGGLGAMTGCPSQGSQSSCQPPPFLSQACSTCVQSACSQTIQSACSLFSGCYCSCVGDAGTTTAVIAGCTLECASGLCETGVAQCAQEHCATACGLPPPSDGGTSDAGSTSDGGTNYCGQGVPYSGTLGAGVVPVPTLGTIYPVQAGFEGDCKFNTQSGMCNRNTCCVITIGDGGPPGSASPVSAGTIVVTDGTTTIATLVPGDGGNYPSVNSPMPLQPGDTIQFAASGATVAAFSGTAKVVSPFANLSPAISQTGAPIQVSLSQNFTLTWSADTASGAANEIVSLLLGSNGNTHLGITCVYDDSKGSLTIPTSLLSQLGSPSSGIIDLTRTTYNDIQISNASIALNSVYATGGQVTLTP
jgi:hypothetical protein